MLMNESEENIIRWNILSVLKIGRINIVEKAILTKALCSAIPIKILTQLFINILKKQFSAQYGNTNILPTPTIIQTKQHQDS